MSYRLEFIIETLYCPFLNCIDFFCDLSFLLKQCFYILLYIWIWVISLKGVYRFGLVKLAIFHWIILRFGAIFLILIRWGLYCNVICVIICWVFGLYFVNLWVCWTCSTCFWIVRILIWRFSTHLQFDITIRVIMVRSFFLREFFGGHLFRCFISITINIIISHIVCELI